MPAQHGKHTAGSVSTWLLVAFCDITNEFPVCADCPVHVQDEQRSNWHAGATCISLGLLSGHDFWRCER